MVGFASGVLLLFACAQSHSDAGSTKAHPDQPSGAAGTFHRMFPDYRYRSTHRRTAAVPPEALPPFDIGPRTQPYRSDRSATGAENGT